MSKKQSFSQMLKQEDLVLVDFYADWCGPCKTMKPILDETKIALQGKAKVLKVNVDNNQHAAQHYRIQSIPTIILFKHGEIKWRQAGVVQKNTLIEVVNKHL